MDPTGVHQTRVGYESIYSVVDWHFRCIDSAEKLCCYLDDPYIACLCNAFCQLTCSMVLAFLDVFLILNADKVNSLSREITTGC